MKKKSPGKRRGASSGARALARENRELRVRLAEARRENEERLRRMGDNLPDSVLYQYAYETHDTPRFLHISKGVEQLNGVNVEEVLRDAGTLLRQIPPEHRERLVQAEKRSARELTDFDMELPMRRPDGEVRWMRLRSRPHRMADGRVVWDGVQTDITERKRAEEALRQREEQFRAFFNTVAVGTAALGADGRFLEVNERLTRITGYRREELLRMTPAFLTRPEDSERENKALSAHLAGHSPAYRAEKRYVRKDGHTVWVEITAAMVPDSAGNPVRSVGVIQDITARKRAEEALRESEEKFSKAFAQNAAPMFISRLKDGRYLDVNDTWLEMFGFRREEVVGRTALELNVWAAKQERDRAIDELRSNGCFRNGDFRLRRRSGESFAALASAEVVTMAGEKVVLGSCVDITERKRAEEALRESEQRFRHLSEYSPDFIALHDLQLRHLYVNPAIAGLVGRPQQAFVGRSVGEMVAPPEAAREIERMLRRALETDAACQEEFIFPTPAGPRHFLWRSVPLRGTDGKTQALLAISTDISAHKQAAEALQLAKEELAKTNANLEAVVRQRTEQLEGTNKRLKEENEQRRHIEQELRASEQRLRAMADAIPQLAWIADADGSFRWYNRRSYEYTGLKPEQGKGWGWRKAHDPNTLPAVLERWNASLASGEPFEMVFPLRGADGVFRSFLTRVQPLKDAQGTVVQWFGTSTDVDELKRAEEALRQSEQRYRGLVDVCPDAICISRNNRITFVNRAGLRLFGASDPAQLLGRPPFRLFRPGARSASEGQIEQALEAGKDLRPLEAQIVRLDGAVRDVEVAFCPFPEQGGTSLQVLVHDTTERKLLERETLSAIDQERQRLGRELHDGLCQILTATKFRLALLERKLARRSGVEPTEARAMELEINRAMEQARAMAHGLNPVKLVAQGLVSALEELAASVQGSGRLDCVCECDERVTVADPETARHLYRIAQEAVHNALKHGKARDIRIQLKKLGEGISLAVQDDGVGFLPNSVPGAGMGLHNMKARAELIGGSLDIQPGQAGGTVVTCTLPRPPEEPAPS